MGSTQDEKELKVYQERRGIRGSMLGAELVPMKSSVLTRDSSGLVRSGNVNAILAHHCYLYAVDLF